MQPVSITVNDVSPTLRSDTVALASPELIDNLVHSQADTLAFLSDDLAPVDIDDITIDALGRVVVANSDFANAVRESLTREGTQLFNWKCTTK